MFGPTSATRASTNTSSTCWAASRPWRARRGLAISRPTWQNCSIAMAWRSPSRGISAVHSGEPPMPELFEAVLADYHDRYEHEREQMKALGKATWDHADEFLLPI